jgi:DNA helicase-2/ATP-dependent DNA helicase PcrA
MNLLNDLNDRQRAAVKYNENPLLILAGAGSGKTRTLTYKIAYLISHYKIDPSNILAMTFTNKAAREMKERINKLVGGDAKSMWIGTFHSICTRILRLNIQALGYKNNFTILDEQDQLATIKQCLNALKINDKDYPPNSISSRINLCKNYGIYPWEEQTSSINYKLNKINEVTDFYQRFLVKSNLVDFGDLLLLAVKLLQDHAQIRRFLYDRWQYILVDEYQDTNYVQFKLLKLLAGDKKGLSCVGDEDQSIYRWRGAEIKNILNFKKDFKGAKIIKLEENYRSTKTILAASNSVIKNNNGRIGKILFSNKENGEKIFTYLALDEKEEAKYVIQKILYLMEKNINTKFIDFGIFYRTNAQSRVFEEECIRNKIPYVIVGGFKFYDRMEIRDIIAYLKVIENSKDNISLNRIINTPNRGIGNTTKENLNEIARKHSTTLFDAISIFIACEKKSKTKENLEKFYDLLNNFITLKETSSVYDLVIKILDETGYLAKLKEENTEESTSRIENLREFINSIEDYYKVYPEKKLGDYLENISLVQNEDALGSDADRLTLMTLHCAKGLEFENVFMVGMEEGLFPHSRSMNSGEEFEEERRLMYVGMTRAKKRLFITLAQTRRKFGSIGYNLPSCFIDEISPEFVIKNFNTSSVFDLDEDPVLNEMWNNKKDADYDKL